MARIIHYFDYKSPYAYLAQEAAFELAARAAVEIEWRPYTLLIDKYLGSAHLDANGQDTLGTRNDHQWRRVRYSYMDCRREANRRGLTIRGPRKIFDSVPAHVAFLFARERGPWRALHEAMFARFWRRELDIEDLAVLCALLDEHGFDGAAFPAYLAGEGRALHDAMQREAEDDGVFGVPSWWVEGELFWGLERLERVTERLASLPSR